MGGRLLRSPTTRGHAAQPAVRWAGRNFRAHAPHSSPSSQASFRSQVHKKEGRPCYPFQCTVGGLGQVHSFI